ncbi:antibiotic biosynthesis monooxygenase [Aestuariirhabdus litorea]|uniref:Antibiotic biosynthesis monooxygenase n=1 Tax=Aestuariirhabdus litorea TaxID=2528527 RepID=A0A3P3VNX7_9GAMM|nr:antibiotic biosynthesis monooxygenase [Aestuariirhabdus litorea]RWW98649.1 antibiotic biosynthesis monooxygenase [Endozoicomonadaceae bacterium GTF-13]
MYAVIFTATLKLVDADYLKTAARLRELALSRYGCLAFSSVTEGKREIAISYWETEAAIADWKRDPEHRQAQLSGRDRWYASYRVEVARIERQYEQSEEGV